MKKEERIAKFQQIVWDFYQKNKRAFPWRETADPYKILVSEIMLQQTQADRVVAFYENWIKRFPDFETLAQAKFSDIYPYWQGLGYNRRALNLQKTAQKVTNEFDGKLPQEITELESLPGIGPYTARAVSIFSFNTPIFCIETNIRRVFIHHFFSAKKKSRINADKNADLRGYKISDAEILKIAELAFDQQNSREWHWALMDYGSHLRTTLSLSKGGNPNRRAKNYAVQSKFEGSIRQIRGAILKQLLIKNMTAVELIKVIGKDAKKTKEILKTLEAEGLIKQHKKRYCLN
jgi:A/G-specific adenine glycosylase